MCKAYPIQAILSVVVLAASMNAAAAQAPPAASKCADFRTLFQGVRDARMRLTRGVFRGKGHQVLRTDAQGSLEGDVSFFCAFDYLEKRIRCDRQQPAISIDAETQKPTVKTIGYHLVQSPEKTLYLDLMGGIGTVDIQSVAAILSVAAPDFSPPLHGRPIDVRTFGLMGWAWIDKGGTFEEASDGFDKCNVVSAREEADGRCVLTILPINDVKIELWINSERGYTAERSETRVLDGATKEWGNVMSFVDVTWTERDGVCVPTSINMERNFNGREAYFATLEWESVNQEPMAKLFEPDGLGLNPESIIVDDRLGDKPVVIGLIKDGGHAPTPPPPLGAKQQTGTRLIWLLAGNAVAVGLVGAYCLWRWRRMLGGFRR